MQRHYKIKLSTILGILIVSYFPCFSMEESKTSEQEKSKYSLKEHQPEEKWRWRKGFKISAINSISPNLPLDFSETHNNLARLEYDMRNSGIISEQDTNILVPAITVIFTNDKGILCESTGNIYNYMPAYKNTHSFVTFLSGAARTSQGTIKLFDVNNKLVNVNYSPLSSFHLAISPETNSMRLQQFYKILTEDKECSLNIFRKFALETLSIPNSQHHNCGTYFSHTEQWLIYYLSKQNNQSLAYDNLCKAIASAVRGQQNITITNVILHMHSTFDVCDICSPSLSIFLEELNASKDIIIKALTSGILSYNQVTAAIDDSLNFSMIASSKGSHLAQAAYRKHYYRADNKHGQRRIYFGIDQLTSDKDTITEFGNNDLPYSYIQVPIEEIRIKVGSTIPF